jgi:hypothetical protein
MIDKIRLDQHLRNGKIEYVMCSANYYDDGLDYKHKPYNIDKGFVLCGWRHGCVGESYLALNHEAKRWDHCIQGFLTTKNRFLNREEALILVLENNQLKQPLIGGELSSEDLW